MSEQENNVTVSKRIHEIITEIERCRSEGKRLDEKDKMLRQEFAELYKYHEDETGAATFWVGENNVSLSRSVSKKVDEKGLKKLLKEHPGLGTAFKAEHKVIAKFLKTAGPVYGPLIESVITEKPGSLALAITRRKGDDE